MLLTEPEYLFTLSDAYLDGGPTHPGAAGLPDGFYYVQVTKPDVTLLGTSVGAASPTPVQVISREFAACDQLTAILIKASDSTAGYDLTSNPGGEYKVWVSNEPTFLNNSSKTDNFKVRETEAGGGIAGEPESASLCVLKFYDANANGINDDSQPITGWKLKIEDGISLIRYTPANVIVAPDEYTISEFARLKHPGLPRLLQM